MSNTSIQQHNADHLLSHDEQNILNDFKDLIEARMLTGVTKGFKNWQDPQNLPDNKLRILLVKALREADWGSVAAYAMMAQHRNLQVVEQGQYALPHSVLVTEELNRDFVNIWTRDEKRDATWQEVAVERNPPFSNLTQEAINVLRHDPEGRN